MRRLAGPVALLALAAGLAAAPARADVFTWVDEAGTVHFSEDPPPDARRARKVHLPPAPPPEQAQPKPKAEERPAPAEDPPPAPPPRKAPTVEIFGTSWCGFCARAREFFRRKGIAVIDHDIEREPEAHARKVALTGNEAVPTVVIGGKVIQGYRPAEFERALAQ